MGRWLEKIRKCETDVPTEPTKARSVSSVGSPPSYLQEKAPAVPTAANESCAVVSQNLWLLIVLNDGQVIQQCTTGPGMDIGGIEKRVRRQYGELLKSVPAVPSCTRPLSEDQIVNALAGTYKAPVVAPSLDCRWLADVAHLLQVLPEELLGYGYLEPHDLIECAWASAEQVAEQIRSGPTWIARIDTPVTGIN